MVDKCEKAMKQFSAMKTVQFIGMSYKQLVIKYLRLITMMYVYFIA